MVQLPDWLKTMSPTTGVGDTTYGTIARPSVSSVGSAAAPSSASRVEAPQFDNKFLPQPESVTPYDLTPDDEELIDALNTFQDAFGTDDALLGDDDPFALTPIDDDEPEDFGYGQTEPSAPASVSEPEPAPVVTGQGNPNVERWGALIKQASEKHGVPESVIKATIDLESNGNNIDNPAITVNGYARGLMQVTDIHWKPGEDPSDPAQNIDKGTALLKANYVQTGSWDKAFAKYYGAYDHETNEITDWADNSGVGGHGYVNRAMERLNKYGGIPAEYSQPKAPLETQPETPTNETRADLKQVMPETPAATTDAVFEKQADATEPATPSSDQRTRGILESVGDWMGITSPSDTPATDPTLATTPDAPTTTDQTTVDPMTATTDPSALPPSMQDVPAEPPATDVETVPAPDEVTPATWSDTWQSLRDQATAFGSPLISEMMNAGKDAGTTADRLIKGAAKVANPIATFYKRNTDPAPPGLTLTEEERGYRRKVSQAFQNWVDPYAGRSLDEWALNSGSLAVGVGGVLGAAFGLRNAALAAERDLASEKLEQLVPEYATAPEAERTALLRRFVVRNPSEYPALSTRFGQDLSWQATVDEATTPLPRNKYRPEDTGFFNTWLGALVGETVSGLISRGADYSAGVNSYDTWETSNRWAESSYRATARLVRDNPQWKQYQEAYNIDLDDPNSLRNWRTYPILIGQAIPNVLENGVQAAAAEMARRPIFNASAAAGQGAKGGAAATVLIRALQLGATFTGEAGGSYVKATKAGLSRDDARAIAHVYGAVSTVIEHMPLPSLPGKDSKLAKQQVTASLMRNLIDGFKRNAVKEPFKDAGEEWFQNLWDNATESTYNENKSLLEDGFASLVGGYFGSVVGNGVRGGVGAIGRVASRSTPSDRLDALLADPAVVERRLQLAEQRAQAQGAPPPQPEREQPQVQAKLAEAKDVEQETVSTLSLMSTIDRAAGQTEASQAPQARELLKTLPDESLERVSATVSRGTDETAKTWVEEERTERRSRGMSASGAPASASTLTVNDVASIRRVDDIDLGPSMRYMDRRNLDLLNRASEMVVSPDDIETAKDRTAIARVARQRLDDMSDRDVLKMLEYAANSNNRVLLKWTMERLYMTPDERAAFRQSEEFVDYDLNTLGPGLSYADDRGKNTVAGFLEAENLTPRTLREQVSAELGEREAARQRQEQINARIQELQTIEQSRASDLDTDVPAFLQLTPEQAQRREEELVRRVAALDDETLDALVTAQEAQPLTRINGQRHLRTIAQDEQDRRALAQQQPVAPRAAQPEVPTLLNPDPQQELAPDDELTERRTLTRLRQTERERQRLMPDSDDLLSQRTDAALEAQQMRDVRTLSDEALAELLQTPNFPDVIGQSLRQILETEQTRRATATSRPPVVAAAQTEEDPAAPAQMVDPEVAPPPAATAAPTAPTGPSAATQALMTKLRSLHRRNQELNDAAQKPSSNANKQRVKRLTAELREEIRGLEEEQLSAMVVVEFALMQRDQPLKPNGKATPLKKSRLFQLAEEEWERREAGRGTATNAPVVLSREDTRPDLPAPSVLYLLSQHMLIGRVSITSVELAREMGIQQSHADRLLERLRAAGFVSRPRQYSKYTVVKAPEVIVTPDVLQAAEGQLPADTVQPELFPTTTEPAQEIPTLQAPPAEEPTAAPPPATPTTRETLPAPRAGRYLDTGTSLSLNDKGHAVVTLRGPRQEIARLRQELSLGLPVLIGANGKYTTVRIFDRVLPTELARNEDTLTVYVDPRTLDATNLLRTSEMGNTEYQARPKMGALIFSGAARNRNARSYATPSEYKDSPGDRKNKVHAARGYGGFSYEDDTAASAAIDPQWGGGRMRGQYKRTPQSLLDRLAATPYVRSLNRALGRNLDPMRAALREVSPDANQPPSVWGGLGWMPGNRGVNQSNGAGRGVNEVILNAHEIILYTLEWADEHGVEAWSPQFRAELSKQFAVALAHEVVHDQLDDHDEGQFEPLAAKMIMTNAYRNALNEVYVVVQALTDDDLAQISRDIGSLREDKDNGTVGLRGDARGDAALAAPVRAADVPPGGRPEDRESAASGTEPAVRPPADPAGVGGTADRPARPAAEPGGVSEPVSPVVGVDPELYGEIKTRVQQGEFGRTLRLKQLKAEYDSDTDPMSNKTAGDVIRALRAEGIIDGKNAVITQPRLPLEGDQPRQTRGLGVTLPANPDDTYRKFGLDKNSVMAEVINGLARAQAESPDGYAHLSAEELRALAPDGAYREVFTKLPSLDELREMFAAGMRYSDWYYEFMDEFEKQIGGGDPVLREFSTLNALFSAQTEVSDHVGAAMDVMILARLYAARLGETAFTPTGKQYFLSQSRDKNTGLMTMEEVKPTDDLKREGFNVVDEAVARFAVEISKELSWSFQTATKMEKAAKVYVYGVAEAEQKITSFFMNHYLTNLGVPDRFSTNDVWQARGFGAPLASNSTPDAVAMQELSSAHKQIIANMENDEVTDKYQPMRELLATWAERQRQDEAKALAPNKKGKAGNPLKSFKFLYSGPFGRDELYDWTGAIQLWIAQEMGVSPQRAQAGYWCLIKLMLPEARDIKQNPTLRQSAQQGYKKKLQDLNQPNFTLYTAYQDAKAKGLLDLSPPGTASVLDKASFVGLRDGTTKTEREAASQWRTYTLPVEQESRKERLRALVAASPVVGRSSEARLEMTPAGSARTRTDRVNFATQATFAEAAQSDAPSVDLTGVTVKQLVQARLLTRKGSGFRATFYSQPLTVEEDANGVTLTLPQSNIENAAFVGAVLGKALGLPYVGLSTPAYRGNRLQGLSLDLSDLSPTQRTRVQEQMRASLGDAPVAAVLGDKGVLQFTPTVATEPEPFLSSVVSAWASVKTALADERFADKLKPAELAPIDVKAYREEYDEIDAALFDDVIKRLWRPNVSTLRRGVFPKKRAGEVSDADADAAFDYGRPGSRGDITALEQIRRDYNARQVAAGREPLGAGEQVRGGGRRGRRGVLPSGILRISGRAIDARGAADQSFAQERQLPPDQLARVQELQKGLLREAFYTDFETDGPSQLDAPDVVRQSRGMASAAPDVAVYADTIDNRIKGLIPGDPVRLQNAAEQLASRNAKKAYITYVEQRTKALAARQAQYGKEEIALKKIQRELEARMARQGTELTALQGAEQGLTTQGTKKVITLINREIGKSRGAITRARTKIAKLEAEGLPAKNRAAIAEQDRLILLEERTIARYQADLTDPEALQMRAVERRTELNVLQTKDATDLQRTLQALSSPEAIAESARARIQMPTYPASLQKFEQDRNLPYSLREMAVAEADYRVSFTEYLVKEYEQKVYGDAEPTEVEGAQYEREASPRYTPPPVPDLLQTERVRPQDATYVEMLRARLSKKYRQANEGRTEGLKPASDYLKVQNADDVKQYIINTLEGFVSIDTIKGLLGKRRPYLNDVMAFMDEVRADTLSNGVDLGKLAGAYFITVSSQGSGQMQLDAFEEKMRLLGYPMDVRQISRDLSNGTRDDLFIEYIPEIKNGQKTGVIQQMIRPEEAAAAWLATPSGLKAVQMLRQGVFADDLWLEGANVRLAFGDNRLVNNSVVSNGVDLKAEMYDQQAEDDDETPELTANNLKNLASVVTLLNEELTLARDAQGQISPEQFERILNSYFATLSGISTGKTGFLSQMFGVATYPTLDAVALNVMLTGRGAVKINDATTALNTPEFDANGTRTEEYEAKQELGRRMMVAVASKEWISDKPFSTWFRDQVADVYRTLRAQNYPGTRDISEDKFMNIMHHWLWDRGKGDYETSHAGSHAVLRLLRDDARHTALLSQVSSEATIDQPPERRSRAMATQLLHDAVAAEQPQHGSDFSIALAQRLNTDLDATAAQLLGTYTPTEQGASEARPWTQAALDEARATLARSELDGAAGRADVGPDFGGINAANDRPGLRTDGLGVDQRSGTGRGAGVRTGEGRGRGAADVRGDVELPAARRRAGGGGVARGDDLPILDPGLVDGLGDGGGAAVQRIAATGRRDGGRGGDGGRGRGGDGERRTRGLGDGGRGLAAELDGRVADVADIPQLLPLEEDAPQRRSRGMDVLPNANLNTFGTQRGWGNVAGQTPEMRRQMARSKAEQNRDNPPTSLQEVADRAAPRPNKARVVRRYEAMNRTDLADDVAVLEIAATKGVDRVRMFADMARDPAHVASHADQIDAMDEVFDAAFAEEERRLNQNTRMAAKARNNLLSAIARALVQAKHQALAKRGFRVLRALQNFDEALGDGLSVLDRLLDRQAVNKRGTQADVRKLLRVANQYQLIADSQDLDPNSDGMSALLSSLHAAAENQTQDPNRVVTYGERIAKLSLARYYARRQQDVATADRLTTEISQLQDAAMTQAQQKLGQRRLTEKDKRRIIREMMDQPVRELASDGKATRGMATRGIDDLAVDPALLEAAYEHMTAAQQRRLQQALDSAKDNNLKRRVQGLYRIGENLVEEIVANRATQDDLGPLLDQLNETALGQIAAERLQWLLATRAQALGIDGVQANSTLSEREYTDQRASIERGVRENLNDALTAAFQQLSEEQGRQAKTLLAQIKKDPNNQALRDEFDQILQDIPNRAVVTRLQRSLDALLNLNETKNTRKRLVEELRELASLISGPQGDVIDAQVSERIRQLRTELRALNTQSKQQQDRINRALVNGQLVRYLGKMNDDDLEKIQDLLATLDTSDPESVVRLLRALNKGTALDSAIEYMYVSRLSGFTTWALTGVNVMSNALALSALLGFRLPMMYAWDATMGRLKYGRQFMTLGDLGSAYAGVGRELLPAFTASAKMWMLGYDPEQKTKAFLMGDMRGIGEQEYLTELTDRLKLGTLPDGTPVTMAPLGMVLHAFSTRPLAAADLFFRRLIEQATLHEMANARAREQGLDSQQVIDNITAYPDIMAEMKERADYTLLQKDTVFTKMFAMLTDPAKLATMSKWQRWSAYTARILLSILVPFARVSHNVAKQGLQYSPLGAGAAMGSLAYQYTRSIEDMTLEQRRAQARTEADIAARMVGGMGIMVFAALMYGAGLITGEPPEDDEEWKLSHKPRSIKINGQWYSYDSTPLAIPLSMTVTAIDRFTREVAKQERSAPTTLPVNVDKLATQQLQALEKSKLDYFTIISKSITGGIAGGTEALANNYWLEQPLQVYKLLFDSRNTDTFSESVSRFASNQLTLVIPAIVSQAEAIFDTYDRAADTFVERFMKRVPGLRQSLEVAHDNLGRPVLNPRAGVVRGVLLTSPKIEEDQSSPATEVIKAFNLKIGRVPKSVGVEGTDSSFELTVEERRLYQRHMGQLLNKELTRIANSPGYARYAADWDRVSMREKLEVKDLIQNEVISAARAAAKERVLQEVNKNPARTEQVKAQLRARRGLLIAE